MKIRKFVRSKKGISPIFASLILIAIAVIAGIVVYMFTSGTIGTLTGGGSAAQEKAAVQGVSYSATDVLTIYASCVEGGPISITGVIVKDMTGATVASPVCTGTLPDDGTLITLTTAACVPALTAGEQYTVTLTSANGGAFVSSSSKP